MKLNMSLGICGLDIDGLQLTPAEHTAKDTEVGRFITRRIGHIRLYELDATLNQIWVSDRCYK